MQISTDVSAMTQQLMGMSAMSGMQGMQGAQGGGGMPPPPPPGGGKGGGGEDPLSEYINSIDSEDGTAIQSSLASLSVDGQDALKEALGAFREEGMTLSQEDREEGFMSILNDVFSEFGGDSGASSAILSTYA